MAVRIVTDSACSLSDLEIAEHAISIVELHISMDGEEFTDKEARESSFLRRLEQMNEAPVTSQPSPEEFADAFRESMADGDDVLAVLISAGMSGTVRSAELAAGMMEGEHLEGCAQVLDSRSNSLEEGFAVLSAAEAASDGGSLEECVAAARDTMRRTRFLFTPHSLDYLRRGGRISGAAALASVMLKISPILTAAKGETGVAGVARGSRAARAKVAALMRKDIGRCGLRRVTVQYVVDEQEAQRFATEIVEPIVEGPVPLVPIPPVVGLHVGPAVGVVYETEEPLR